MVETAGVLAPGAVMASSLSAVCSLRVFAHHGKAVMHSFIHPEIIKKPLHNKIERQGTRSCYVKVFAKYMYIIYMCLGSIAQKSRYVNSFQHKANII